MPAKKTDAHEKALDLTEEALEALEEGDEATADRMLKAAKTLDPAAPAEVVRDMDEDAARAGGGQG